MNRRSIYTIVALCVVIGIFFQINRMDGFLHLSSIRNLTLSTLATTSRPLAAVNMDRERYLIIYDPNDVGSMLTRHIAGKILNEQKKDYDEQTVATTVDLEDEDYAGILVMAPNPSSVPGFAAVLDYAAQGGTVAFLDRPSDDSLTGELANAMGIVDWGGAEPMEGIEARDSFMIGATGFSQPAGPAYITEAMHVALGSGTTTHLTTADGTPLLWDNGYGSGRVITYNGVARDEKSNMGIYTAMIAHLGTDTVYPVLGAKVFYIDDFPSPVPEGEYERIYNELHVTTAEFYRSVWWPYMMEVAEKYNLKYTGLIIETYGSQVKGPFEPLGGRATRDNIIVYGRELLAMGGELGLHGYNHMSLAPAGYNQDELGYTPWESEDDMIEAVTELRRFTEELYPNYEFRTYVPPSNILSPEGYDAVKKAYPSVKIFASLWDGLPSERAFYQDFGRGTDGIYNIPRVSSGYTPTRGMMWDDICAANYLGIFTHFVHPDEIFYEESEDSSWAKMHDGLLEFLAEINERYPWLAAMTASEAMESMEDWETLDYRVEREETEDESKMTIYSWGTRQAPHFIVRSTREVESSDGCTVTWIDNGAYMVEATDQTATIYWKKETH